MTELLAILCVLLISILCAILLRFIVVNIRTTLSIQDIKLVLYCCHIVDMATIKPKTLLVLVILFILCILHWVAINCYNCSELLQFLTISLTIVYNVTKYAKVLPEIVGQLLAILYTKSKCCCIAALPLQLRCCLLAAVASVLATYTTRAVLTHTTISALNQCADVRTPALQMGAFNQNPRR